MEIRLLGPVEVDDGRPIDIGHARQRCVLAALAADPGKLLPMEDLIDRVWGERPPASARQTLQAYVSRLRTALATAAVSLVGRDGGYVLEIDSDLIDIYRFRRLVVEARGALAAGDDDHAAEGFAAALTLWRGEPLGGLDGAWVERLRRSLAEEWLAVTEDRLELDLQRGRHRHVTAELASLVQEHPWRERLVGQLMLALYRSQRQNEALAAYRDLKARLGEEGLDPGPGLQNLELRILRADPDLDRGADGIEPAPAAAAVMADGARRDLIEEVRRQWIHAELTGSPLVSTLSEPRSSRITIGLAEQADAVRDSYRDTESGPLAPSQPLAPGTRLVDLVTARFNRRCLILGDAGAGKTTMLLELARDLLDRAAADPATQVPVVFLLSRWSPRHRLFHWVVAELGEHYRVPADAARRWLASGQLTVLLDGLDEVPRAQRRACVAAINQFRQAAQSSLSGLVVTSRTDSYVELERRLDLGGGVTLQPLSQQQIVDHLADLGLAELSAATAADPELAEVLTTPLMLHIAVLAGPDPEGIRTTLTVGGADEYRRQLYDRGLGRLFQRDRGLRGRRSSSARSDGSAVTVRRRGLVWLARLMTNRGETIFYPDWFTIAWLPGRNPPWPLPGRRWITSWRLLAEAGTYGLVAGLISGAVYGLQAGLIDPGTVRGAVLDVPPGYAVLVAVTVCLSVGLTVILRRHGRAVVARGPLIRRAIVYGAVFFAAGGLHKGLVTAQESGNGRGLIAGVAGGLVYGLTTAASMSLAIGIAHWLVRRDSSQPDPRWRWSWSRIALGLDVAVAITLAVAISTALARLLNGPATAYATWTGLGYGLIIGLGGGLIIGMAFGLVDLNSSRPAARWRWSIRRLAWSLLAAVAYGTVHWLVFVVGVGAIMGPDQGPIFSLLIGLTFWLTFAVGYASVPDRNRPPPAPARALSASLRAALPPMLVASGLSLLGALVARADIVDYVHILVLTPALLAGSLTFWFTGGADWLNHHVARWVAWWARLLPRDLLRFLGHADEQMLLRRSGGGYLFPHHTIQEYLAGQNPDGPWPGRT
jgi:DNA-binding SARP family transcriptional activator